MLNIKYLLVSKPGPQFDELSKANGFVPVFSQERVAVFENKAALPRFFSVPVAGIEVIPQSDGQLARLKEASFDPEKSVIFREKPAMPATTSSVGVNKAQIDVVDKGINGYRLRVESNGPAVVVVSQIFYPGWKATVDGVEIPVYGVNVALTGMVLPGGSHDVHLFFRPASFRVGSAISLVSVAVFCALLII
jgi:hypothetical protein